MRFIHLRHVSAFAFAFVMLAAACTPPTSSTGTATPAPVKQEITVVQATDPATIDPQGTATRVDLNVILHFAEALTKVTFSDRGEPTVSPSLATSWRQPDDSTWQFKLRENVKFSNGESFDADAVKFSFDRIMSPSYTLAGAKQYTNRVAKVEVVDKNTVNFVTKTPSALIPLDFTQIFIVPPKYTAEQGTQFATKPVGTGAFKLVERVKDQHVILEANPNYWGGRPKLNRITFKPVGESATRSAAIQTGEADVVVPIAANDVANLKSKTGFTVGDNASTRVYYIVLDSANDPIMKNVKVRQALNYGVDKEAIVKSIYQGYGTVLQGQGLNATYYGFNPNVKAYPYDVAKAKQLLTEAGYPNGFEMTIHTPRGNYPGDVETVQAVAGQLANIGVRATVKPYEFAVYIAEFGKFNLKPAVLAAWSTYPDADSMFEAFRGGAAFSLANSPELNAALAQARATLDPAKRLQLLQEAAKVENEQALAIWLHGIQNFWAVGNKVQGFKLWPNAGFDLFTVSMK